MKFAWISQETPDPCSTSRRLILIFAGWGMDEKPFVSLRKPGYDIAVVWGLLDDVFPIPTSILAHYAEICVIAWSFGVYQASRILPSLNLRNLTLSLAVNGSQWPVHESLGIPTTIFRATVESLSPATLSRFYRRMAGGGDAFRRFSANCPDRSVDELADELRRVALLSSSDDAPLQFRWDRALIGQRDAIFPPDNLMTAWSRSTAAITSDSSLPHLPDWQSVIDRFITDKRRVSASFDSRRATYSGNATVQQQVASRLASLIASRLPASCQHPDVIEIGSGDGTFTRQLISRLSPSTLRLIDLSGSTPAPLPPSSARISFKAADGETYLRQLPDSSTDVITASSTIQWFNSLPVFFREVARVLAPGGIAAFSSYGPDTFSALTALTGRSLPYLSLPEILHALPPSCQVLHSESASISLSFPSVSEMLRHLQLTGVNALSDAASVPLMRRLLSDYPTSPSGECQLTYNPIYLIFTRTS